MTVNKDVRKAEPHIPNAGMKAEAKRGLAWRKEFGRGGTAVGVARARDILNAKSLPIDTVKRMYSYFSRHEVDKKAEGFERGEEGYPSAGRIAWALWGGDAGFSWSKRLVESHKGTGENMDKGYGLYDEEKAEYGDTAQGVDAMTHLLMAYRLMMDHEKCWPLLKPLMKLIHLLEQKMIMEDEETYAEEGEEGEEVYIEEGSGLYGRRRRRRMAKIITLEEGQYCVRSEETGRSFGCYETETMAEARLAQIESFASSKLADAPTDALTKWYAQSFKVDPMSPSLKTVQELINDELVARSDRINTLEKAHNDSLPLMKQEEDRYTLGPVYVPGVEDAHGEFTDERTLQKALWNWVKKDNRSIYLQHTDKVAGEMVEMLTWPFEVETNLTVPNQGVTKYKFPADTPFMGVVWEDWAWDLIKAGELRGYSIGGMARRLEANLPEAA